MKDFKNHTLQEYLEGLSARTPVPGGGSVAALVAALGVGLMSMVAHYSLGKGKPKNIEIRIKSTLAKSEKLRRRLLELVDLDAQAYLQVVKTRQAPWKIKQKALKGARDVPKEVCRLCYSAMDLAPFLVKEGNQNLLSDVQVAVELLSAAFESAMVNVAVNA